MGTPLFQITPVLNTGLSLSEPLKLYKGNHWTQCACFMDASWVPLGITNDDLGTSWGGLGYDLGTTLAKLGKTLAYSNMLWHTLAYSGILWHTLAYSVLLQHTLAYSGIL